MGNRITMELYAKLVGEEGAEAESLEAEHTHEHEHAEGEEHDHDHEHGHDHGLGGNEFIHEHDAVMVLRDENE
jgi:hypothetical protein